MFSARCHFAVYHFFLSSSAVYRHRCLLSTYDAFADADASLRRAAIYFSATRLLYFSPASYDVFIIYVMLMPLRRPYDFR